MQARPASLRRMSGRRRPDPIQATIGWFRNLGRGEMGLPERGFKIGANLLRRYRGHGCCGNYGEPGC